MSKIFFSGIAGSGVSAIAGFMADRGHSVAGSDRLFDKNPAHPLFHLFRVKGITIVPQDGTGINHTCDLAVFSTAVEDGQPEVIRAKQLGIPMKTRPEYLSEIASQFRTVAVGGTSGKSTMAGMLAFLMHTLGLEPNFIGGGRVKQFRNERNSGNFLSGNSDLLVMEACESDGTIVYYQPLYSIIANLSLDHNPVERTGEMFETLGRNTRERLFINRDDLHLRKLHFERAVTFSVKSHADYRAEAIEHHPFAAAFTVHGQAFSLSLPGIYNIYNALACIALLSEMGIGLKALADVLPLFSGIERRFDIHLNSGKYLVIDDYAHNPHKIASLMETAKRIRDRICYIFQPHGYGPTRLMKQGYIDTFSEHLRADDHLMLLPIYYAGGTAHPDITSEDLADPIRHMGRTAEAVPERSVIFDRLKGWDTYIVFGARDESLANFARDIAGRLK